MGDASSPTFREFVDLLISVTPEPALKTDEFKAAWDEATTELGEIIEKLKENESDTDLVYKRDATARKLIAFIRTQLRDSYLFNDAELQNQAGSSALFNYSRALESGSVTKCAGHDCDGIVWNPECETLPPPVTGRSMEFRGGSDAGHPYASCWDHAITNLVCKTWGYSKISYLRTPCSDKLISGSTYKPRDKSIFLALMLGVHKDPGDNWRDIGICDVLKTYTSPDLTQKDE